MPNPVSTESTRGISDVTFLSETSALKRKSIEKSTPSTSAKKQKESGPPHVSFLFVFIMALN